MSVNSIHGMSEPFRIVIPALKPGEHDVDGAAMLTDADTFVPRLERHHHVYVGTFWLVAGKGRGREAIKTDMRGNVRPDLRVMRLYVGTPGAKVSPLDRRELDLTDVLIRLQAQGFVRVDHLKDEDGEPLGDADKATKRDRTRWRDWCWRVLNPARLRQLHDELQASETGRGLIEGWRPQVSDFIRMELERPGSKVEARRKHDRSVLETANVYLAKAAARVEEALSEPEPEPGEDEPAWPGLFRRHTGGSATREETVTALGALTHRELAEAAKEVGASPTRGAKVEIVEGLMAYLDAYGKES